MALLAVDQVLCYDVLAIAVVVLVVEVIMALWSRRGNKLSPEEAALLKQYNEQVRVVNRLNSVETFVEQSKAIRKMNSIKKQMQERAVERMQRTAPSVLEKRFNQLRTPLVMLFLGVYYWNEPLVVMPQGAMMPLERFLAMPAFPLGSVSAVSWASVCKRVASKLVA